MKVRLLLLFLALSLGCQQGIREKTTPTPAPVFRVKVLTYNVLGGRNTDGARDLSRLAEVINTLDPDVVADDRER